MIRWFSNFQIPESGIQTRWVYAIQQHQDTDTVTVGFYADPNRVTHLYDRKFPSPPLGVNLDDYLLKLPEFSQYEKAESPPPSEAE
jgi:hypothetical protein